MNILSSIRKSIIIRKISKQISKPIRSMADLMDDSYSQSKDRLFKLILEDFKNLQPIVIQYGITYNTLNDILTKLSATGAGQWVRGHYVAVSALVFPSTLEYCAKMHQLYEIDWREVTFKLILYFEHGETGPVL